MILLILMTALIVLFYPRNSRNQRTFKGWIKTYRIPIILTLTIVIPLLMMNLFFRHRPLGFEERLELLDRYGQEAEENEAFIDYVRYRFEDPSVQLRYVDYYLNNYLNDFSCRAIHFWFKDNLSNAGRLARIYADYRCKPKSILKADLDKFADTLATINFMKGLQYAEKGQHEKAVEAFSKEIVTNPAFTLSYEALIRSLYESDITAFKEYLNSPEGLESIPGEVFREYHYRQGNWLSYYQSIFFHRILTSDLPVVLSAFLVSFVWLYYLRMMDIYRREKWVHVGIVFLLGGIFSIFCIPIYDYFHFERNFYLTGDGWNDFVYSTVVIGGGEELVKAIPWFAFGLITRKFREPFDYILYASASALGFAFIENLIYLERYDNIVLRAMMSAVFHMFCGCIVAYGLILARYRLKNDNALKMGAVILGFALAVFSHGFYDFWLISDAVTDYAFVTFLFFILSVHIWFYFKNNAMNHSPYFQGNQFFNIQYQTDILFVSFIGLLMYEYVLLSLDFGAYNVNYFFYREILFVGLFLLYLQIQLNNFKIKHKVWRKLSFTHLIPSFFTRNDWIEQDSAWMDHLPNNRDLSGLELRLFAPKSNKYIGSRLPVSGYLVRRIRVSGNPYWYIFKLNTPLNYPGYVTDFIIVKNKNPYENLRMSKIEIYFMLVPDRRIINGEPEISDLRYAGRAYSMPIGKD